MSGYPLRYVVFDTETNVVNDRDPWKEAHLRFQMGVLKVYDPVRWEDDEPRYFNLDTIEDSQVVELALRLRDVTLAQGFFWLDGHLPRDNSRARVLIAREEHAGHFDLDSLADVVDKLHLGRSRTSRRLFMKVGLRKALVVIKA